ncbi:PREDICTED: probable ATP-dependent RNA helicase DDX10 isoform X2 [Galeopterus variegatus]|uniref:Probable ATP-dependent RNA helicase DDX10 isoform X2 n=1 Tax=Galeopterus variegatus TaxID=482537 RepID=A0ABM0Q1I2_GALVR|nr:PREDICTED: probable ATP-dependent RNA helicase DDX10 isoform X2 [Galeopterus variegatus]
MFSCYQSPNVVLDEADRILDMGFADTMNAIIENRPKKRQTLLFSATQTKSVKDLARLSLKNPEYVWVHEKAKYSTPAILEQNYIVCELQQKNKCAIFLLEKPSEKEEYCIFLQLQRGSISIPSVLPATSWYFYPCPPWSTAADEKNGSL